MTEKNDRQESLRPEGEFRVPSPPSQAAGFLPDLTGEETALYSRHIILPQVGVEGQKKLKNSRVLLVGAGGLGSSVGLYLAAAGVGTIGLADFDRVEQSNLQRQVIHSAADIGRLKTASARDRMLGINPYIHVRTFSMRLSSANALELFKEFDIIVDGSDNFPVRYLINDACAILGKPDVFGSIYRFEGQVTVFDAIRGGCLRCLFPKPPEPGQTPSCGEGGVLGVLAGIVGSIQATEVLKLIVGGAGTLIDRFLAFDAWRMRFHEFQVRKNPACPLCGDEPVIKELIDYEAFCGLGHAEDSDSDPAASISVVELKALLDSGADIQIIDIRLPHELAVSRLPRARSIPLAQLSRRRHELDPARDVVLVCKKGEKSKIALQILREEGYTGRLLNLRGGLNAWAEVVDPAMLRY